MDYESRYLRDQYFQDKKQIRGKKRKKDQVPGILSTNTQNKRRRMDVKDDAQLEIQKDTNRNADVVIAGKNTDPRMYAEYMHVVCQEARRKIEMGGLGTGLTKVKCKTKEPIALILPELWFQKATPNCLHCHKEMMRKVLSSEIKCSFCVDKLKISKSKY